jgi:CubicO group peptidase (beta-lactamase class C family)
MIRFFIYSAFLLLILTSCSSSYHTVLRLPTIFDGDIYGRFPNPEVDFHSKIPKESSFQFPELKNWAQSKKLKKYTDEVGFFEATKTRAFIIISNDTLIYENYFNNAKESDVTQLFSVSKTITTTMLGWAIEDGYIKSLDQKVKEFLPETIGTDLGEVKLKFLANMSSGINHDEYRKILRTLKFYYKKEQDNVCEDVKVKTTPGKKFVYKSIDTQILANCIENASFKTINAYFFEKIWKMLGPEHPSYWSVDSKECNIPKYFGGFNAAAIDIAKFGILYANKGNYEGKNLIPNWWVDYCNDVKNRGLKYNYCNGWWADGVEEPQTRAFFGAGFGGQYLYIDKKKGTVIVRLGEGKSGVKWGKVIDQLNRYL